MPSPREKWEGAPIRSIRPRNAVPGTVSVPGPGMERRPARSLHGKPRAEHPRQHLRRGRSGPVFVPVRQTGSSAGCREAGAPEHHERRGLQRYRDPARSGTIRQVRPSRATKAQVDRRSATQDEDARVKGRSRKGEAATGRERGGIGEGEQVWNPADGLQVLAGAREKYLGGRCDAGEEEAHRPRFHRRRARHSYTEDAAVTAVGRGFLVVVARLVRVTGRCVGVFPVMMKRGVVRRCGLHFRRSHRVHIRVGGGMVGAAVHPLGTGDAQEEEQDGPHEGQRRVAEMPGAHQRVGALRTPPWSLFESNARASSRPAGTRTSYPTFSTVPKRSPARNRPLGREL